MIYKYLLFFFSLFFLFSCNQKRKIKEYTNNTEYTIKVGETLEIYYSTNSCCFYCRPNINELKHLEFLGEKIVVPMKKNCAGCNATYALMFKANSLGKDTLYGQIVAASRACPDSTREMYEYIVTIE
jgi:hypothetical protein